MVKEKILITGGNGLLAKKIGELVDNHLFDIYYLSRKPTNKLDNSFLWDLEKNHIDKEALVDVSHIIHLAGFNISNKWTKKNKRIMFDSRIKTSKLLYKKCIDFNINPKTFISASAMGYYGLDSKGKKNEKDKPAKDWMSKLCINWEKSADEFKSLGSRVIKLRFSLILDKKKGVLQKILLGYQFRTGTVFGNGKQMFPWIHINDAANFILYTLTKKEINGVYNVASNENISYLDVIKTIKKIKYPFSFLVFLPKNIIIFLLGEKAKLLFSNITLCVKKMKETGFKLKYEKFEKLVQQELKNH